MPTESLTIRIIEQEIARSEEREKKLLEKLATLEAEAAEKKIEKEVKVVTKPKKAAAEAEIKVEEAPAAIAEPEKESKKEEAVVAAEAEPETFLGLPKMSAEGKNEEYYAETPATPSEEKNVAKEHYSEAAKEKEEAPTVETPAEEIPIAQIVENSNDANTVGEQLDVLEDIASGKRAEFEKMQEEFVAEMEEIQNGLAIEIAEENKKDINENLPALIEKIEDTESLPENLEPYIFDALNHASIPSLELEKTPSKPSLKKRLSGTISYLNEKLKTLTSTLRESAKNLIIGSVAATATFSAVNEMVKTHTSPKDLYEIGYNAVERYFKTDDPKMKTVGDTDNIAFKNFMKSDNAIRKTTYDYIGAEKMPYEGVKSGYYSTMVMDLSDRTPPHFEIINGRGDNAKIRPPTLGITTSLLQPFYHPSSLEASLKGHAEMSRDAIPVIAYNLSEKTMKAGLLGEFKNNDDEWLVSETYRVPLDFVTDGANGKIKLEYDREASRMCPLTINENGKETRFQIGVSTDKSMAEVDPAQAERFGKLEGGKCLMACGGKQLQVNGSFAKIYKVYQRLQHDYPGERVWAYLLDNGSFNRPLMEKNKNLSEEDLTKYFNQSVDGGYALALVDDGEVSPFEYKNTYKETRKTTDDIRTKPGSTEKMINEKTAVVLEMESGIDKKTSKKESAGAHVVIHPDGTRTIFNTENDVMSHEGKVVLDGRGDVDAFSIRVAIEGDGKNAGGPTIAQMESLIECLRPMVRKYNISLDNITDEAAIRDNYRKAHPNDESIAPKNTLDERRLNEIKKLLQKKIYEIDTSANPKDMSMKALQYIGTTAFLETFEKQGDVVRALETTKKILAEKGCTPEQIAGVEYIFTGIEVVPNKKRSGSRIKSI